MTGHSIRFIGHPLIDVGVATLCAAAGVEDPRHLTAEAIDAFTTELVELYLNPAMAGFVSYVVFANARFANPAQLKAQFEPKRRAILNELVSMWKPDSPESAYEMPASPDEVCVFSGDAAKVRVSRMYIPMTTDEKNINFVPEGVPLLPISGWCLLALMAMPLGGLASQGKMWIVHSFDNAATRYFAGRNLKRNRQDFQMAGLTKRPNYKFARTHLLDDLMHAHDYRHRARFPLSAYLFTSSGQKSDIEITHLPSTVIRFALLARKTVEGPWNRIVQRGERLNTAVEIDEGKVINTRRNYFYEDLFELPNSAYGFLRRYLLRMPETRYKDRDDPRTTYSLIEEYDLVSWPLTDLYLHEVMNMDRERIEGIRTVADRIAEYIQSEDERLFKELFNARSEYQFRLALMKADKKAATPLFTLDEFVLAFFTDTDQETLRLDWSLARDLLIIRIIERLYQTGKLEIAQNAVVEEAPAEVDN